MTIRVSNKDREILKDLSKYVWWQDSEYAINHNTLRLIASAMCLANNVEDFIKVINLDKELLKEALNQAQPGWFHIKNWHFWHYRLNVSTLKVDELVAINNLKYAWQFIFDTMQYPKVDFAFVCEINIIIGSGLYNNSGFIRSVPVDIGGTSWKPNLAMKADIADIIDDINNTENATEKAIDLMLYIMRQQMFLDGRKRTATLCANRILIENGAGLINIKVEDIEEFKTKLLKYYETNERDEIKDFLFKNGIDGMEIKKPSQEEIAEQEANTKIFQNYKMQKESNVEIKKIEEMRRELQLKAIEQLKANKER
nr:Fic family protein [uncultured Campylobacter sp.]